MTKGKLTNTYKSLRAATQLVETMFDSEGNQIEPVDSVKVERLKVLTREAACAANAVHATHDGRRK